MDNGIFISQSRHESNPSRQVGAWNKYFDAVSQTDQSLISSVAGSEANSCKNYTVSKISRFMWIGP